MVAVTPSGRYPAVSAFDRQMISGVIPACSQANIFPGAAETGEHLVGDQQRFVFVAQPANARDEFRGPHDHAAGALQHGLDQHRGDGIVASRSAFSMSSRPRTRSTGNIIVENARVKTESSLADIAPTVSP